MRTPTEQASASAAHLVHTQRSVQAALTIAHPGASALEVAAVAEALAAGDADALERAREAGLLRLPPYEALEREVAALAAGTLLPAPLQAQMFTPYAAAADGEMYGFGWFLRGQRVAYHTGETIGFRTAIVRYLDTRMTAIVLTNRSAPAPLALAEALLAGAASL